MIKMTTEEFTSLFFEMERDYKLFEVKYDDIYIWKLLRIFVYKRLEKKLYQVGDYHPKTASQNEILQKAKEECIRIKHNGFKDKSAKDNIVIRHRRRMMVDGEYIEVNTNYLNEIDDRVNDDNTEYIEFAFAYQFRNIQEDTKLVTTSKCSVFTGKVIEKTLKNKSISECAKNLEKIVYEQFSVELELKSLLVDQLVWFKEGYKVYKKYFALKKPKRVYLVCSYGKEFMIQAAHDCGAEVIEIQHGILGPDHMGYSFPYNDEMHYFPDKIYVYGEYWKNVVHFPVHSGNVIVTGNPYYLHQVNNYRDNEQDAHQVLFISSGGYGKEMSKAACDLLRGTTEFKVVYKMHPSEFGVWHSLYDELEILTKDEQFNKRMQVVEDGVPLYKLFATSKFIVGVNSTALYEALAFNPEIIIMNYATLDDMEGLIQKYKLPVLANERELLNYITTNSDRTKQLLENDYFYKDIEVVNE